MRKSLRLIFLPLMVLSGLFLASCAEEEKGTEEVVDINGLSDIRLSYDGSENATFTVSSTRTWSVSKSGMDWLTVTPVSGGSGKLATVTVKAEANDDLERSGRLTVRAGSVKRTITVTQDAFPIVPEIKVYDLDTDIIAFAFDKTDPVVFKVWSNVDWAVEKTGLDWVVVSPESGGRKTESVITVTPELNTGDAREGTLTFKGEGAPDVVIRITQTKYVDDPVFNVTGAEGNEVSFTDKAETVAVLTVTTNTNWTAVKSEGMDWLTVTPASGNANMEGTTVKVSASGNTSAEPRTGTLTFRCEDEAIEDVVITISQAGVFVMPTEWTWTLEDSVLKGTEWVTKGIAADDSKTAEMRWNTVNDDSKYVASDFIVSGDGKGHYARKGAWTDDNLEFSVPVKGFAAGSKASIQFAMSGVATAPCFWMVEYLDGTEWKATSSKPLKSPKGGVTKEATYMLTKKDAVVNVKETATFSNEIVDGTLRFRVRCVAGECLINNDNAARSGKNATIRVRQWSDGSCDAIKIRIEK